MRRVLQIEGGMGGGREGISKGEGEWRGGKEEVRGLYKGREEGYFKGREGGREREGGYYKGREKGRVLQIKGGMDGWKDEDRDGRYYKGSGETGSVLQMDGGSKGGRENITNERIETVISAISNYSYDVMA